MGRYVDGGDGTARGRADSRRASEPLYRHDVRSRRPQEVSHRFPRIVALSDTLRQARFLPVPLVGVAYEGGGYEPILCTITFWSKRRAESSF